MVLWCDVGLVGVELSTLLWQACFGCSGCSLVGWSVLFWLYWGAVGSVWRCLVDFLWAVFSLRWFSGGSLGWVDWGGVSSVGFAG
jgi:hypothetical protein